MSLAVLLIESDSLHAEAAQRWVADAGLAWHMAVADSLEQGQQILSDGAFDVVLVRYELVSHLSLAQALRQAKCPRLLLVRPLREDVCAQALGAGFADCVTTDPELRYLPVMVAKVQLANVRGQEVKRLHEISAQFEFALQHADLGWWVRRLDTARISFSARASALLGCAEGELDGATASWLERIHPDDLGHFSDLNRQPAPQAGETTEAWFQSEYRVRHKRGHWVWILVHGRVMERDAAGLPKRLFGTMTDVTSLRDAQVHLRQVARQLEQKTEQLDVCFGSVSQGILQVSPQGRVINCNQRLLDLLNLPAQMMANAPAIADVIAFQRARGDFGLIYGTDFNNIYEHSADEIRLPGLGHADTPGDYWRVSREGRYLEIKTKRLSDGGWVRTVSDVTDYFQAKAALSQSEARFRSLTELSSDWYWEQDEQFRFVRTDGYDVAKAGLHEDHMLGKTLWELGAINLKESDWDAHRAVLAERGKFRNLEINRLDVLGNSHWLAISGIPRFDETGQFRGYQGVGHDISQRKNAERETAALAFYDALTGLPNRRLVFNRLAKAIEAAARHQAHGALLFIDLDNFKSLNDTQGHDTGDGLLRQVALRLNDCVRAIDTVARLGGDEFVIMLEGLSGDVAKACEQALAVGEKVLAAFQSPFVIDGSLHQSTPSIGVTLFDHTMPGVEELLKQADLAMYQAKAGGRNTQRLFDAGMQQAVTERVKVETELRHAMRLGQVQLVFQPVVDEAGSVQGVEALARWHHPELGQIEPDHFVGVAEQCGLILPLGLMLLRQACEHLARWARSPVTRHLRMAVNVSAVQLRQSDFVAELLAVLEQTGAPAAQLQLELTESTLLNDVQETIGKMEELKSHGIEFVLDDFGTGFSSLSYLKRLPLKHLKIDRSFVRDILLDPNDASIARTVITLAQCLNLGVVAEGVETVGQHEFLLANGCGLFQGYLFGPPDTEAALLILLQSAGCSAAA